MPKVSVVMPVYNLQHYIYDTLTNFRNQTLSDIEIICVNDGSTDDSEKIIEKVMSEDSRVQLINQTNKGAGAARNAGIKKATGEYIYFFDGDDYCELDFLEKAVEKIELTNAQVLVFDFYRVNMQTGEETYCNGLNRSFYPKDKATFNYKDVPFRIMTIAIPTPWNKLYKTEFVKEKGLKFEEISSTNDITFASVSMAMAERVAYLPEAFVYYRMNQGSTTITSQKQKKLGNVVIAVESAARQAEALPYACEIKESIQQFIVENYIFALQNYAGSFRSSFYRKYYKQLHIRFNSPMFDDICVDTLKNKKRFAEFKDIRDNSYKEQFLKKVKKRINKKIDPLFVKFSLLSARRFEKRHKQNAKELKQLKKMLQDQKKDIDLIKRKVGNIERIDKELLSLTKNDIINRSNIDAEGKKSPRIIVSLTTYPGRITTVASVIENMIYQTVAPDMVVLCLSEKNFPNKLEDLPVRLLKLMRHGLTIEWSEEDIRSYKKIIPVLKQFENDIVITVDDDLKYPLDMIEKLYDAHKKFPKAICAFRTHRITLDENGEIAPYSEWVKEDCSNTFEERWDLFATTGAGTLFPPRVFDEEAYNLDDIRELCPTADDIWVKFMAMRNKVPVVLATTTSKLSYLPNTQEDRLWGINITNNDIQFNALLDKYGKEMWSVLKQYKKNM